MLLKNFQNEVLLALNYQIMIMEGKIKILKDLLIGNQFIYEFFLI